jgi:hypothetical protein
MKNLAVSIIAVVAMAMISSCQSYDSGTYSYYSSEKTDTNAEQVEQNGFILKRVKPGDTLWEYSEEVYGTGYKWGEILQENPHLIGRLSYDSNRNLPVVIIYPGESVRIGGKEIYPSFSSSSRSTTKTISSSYKNEKGVSVAWWTWVIPSFLFLLVTVGVLWLRYATRHSRARERERRDQNRLIEEAMISNYGKKVRISWTENSFEVR